MEIPLNVNANNIVMLNYQYIFYAISAYGALNYRKFVEIPTVRKKIYSKYCIGSIMCVLFWVYRKMWKCDNKSSF